VPLGPRSERVNPAPGETNPCQAEMPHQHVRRHWRRRASRGKPGTPNWRAGTATENAARLEIAGRVRAAPDDACSDLRCRARPSRRPVTRARAAPWRSQAATLPAGGGPRSGLEALAPASRAPGSGAAYPRAAPDGVSPGDVPEIGPAVARARVVDDGPRHAIPAQDRCFRLGSQKFASLTKTKLLTTTPPNGKRGAQPTNRRPRTNPPTLAPTRPPEPRPAEDGRQGHRP